MQMPTTNHKSNSHKKKHRKNDDSSEDSNVIKEKISVKKNNERKKNKYDSDKESSDNETSETSSSSDAHKNKKNKKSFKKRFSKKINKEKKRRNSSDDTSEENDEDSMTSSNNKDNTNSTTSNDKENSNDIKISDDSDDSEIESSSNSSLSSNDISGSDDESMSSNDINGDSDDDDVPKKKRGRPRKHSDDSIEIVKNKIRVHKFNLPTDDDINNRKKSSLYIIFHKAYHPNQRIISPIDELTKEEEELIKQKKSVYIILYESQMKIVMEQIKAYLSIADFNTAPETNIINMDWFNIYLKRIDREIKNGEIYVTNSMSAEETYLTKDELKNKDIKDYKFPTKVTINSTRTGGGKTAMSIGVCFILGLLPCVVSSGIKNSEDWREFFIRTGLKGGKLDPTERTYYGSDFVIFSRSSISAAQQKPLGLLKYASKRIRSERRKEYGDHYVTFREGLEKDDEDINKINAAFKSAGPGWLLARRQGDVFNDRKLRYDKNVKNNEKYNKNGLKFYMATYEWKRLCDGEHPMMRKNKRRGPLRGILLATDESHGFKNEDSNASRGINVLLRQVYLSAFSRSILLSGTPFDKEDHTDAYMKLLGAYISNIIYTPEGATKSVLGAGAKQLVEWLKKFNYYTEFTTKRAGYTFEFIMNPQKIGEEFSSENSKVISKKFLSFYSESLSKIINFRAEVADIGLKRALYLSMRKEEYDTFVRRVGQLEAARATMNKQKGQKNALAMIGELIRALSFIEQALILPIARHVIKTLTKINGQKRKYENVDSFGVKTVIHGEQWAKAVIFLTYKADYRLFALKEYIESYGFRTDVVAGDYGNVANSIKRFNIPSSGRMDDKNKESISCLVIMVGMGSQSINLQDLDGRFPRYSYIPMSYYFQTMLQAAGRTDRIGTKSIPTIYTLSGMRIENGKIKNVDIARIRDNIIMKTIVSKKSTATKKGHTNIKFFGDYEKEDGILDEENLDDLTKNRDDTLFTKFGKYNTNRGELFIPAYDKDFIINLSAQWKAKGVKHDGDVTNNKKNLKKIEKLMKKNMENDDENDDDERGSRVIINYNTSVLGKDRFPWEKDIYYLKMIGKNNFITINLDKDLNRKKRDILESFESEQKMRKNKDVKKILELEEVNTKTFEYDRKEYEDKSSDQSEEDNSSTSSSSTKSSDTTSDSSENKLDDLEKSILKEGNKRNEDEIESSSSSDTNHKKKKKYVSVISKESDHEEQIAIIKGKKEIVQRDIPNIIKHYKIEIPKGSQIRRF